MIDRNPAYCVTTRWGLVDVAIPDPDVIRENLLEIIRACSRINRWNGHTNIPWSVSAHSVLCAAVAPPRLRLAMAAHDLHEAIIGDLSRALRTTVEYLEDMDEEWALASFEAVGLCLDDEDRFAIDLIDCAVAATEAIELGLKFPGMQIHEDRDAKPLISIGSGDLFSKLERTTARSWEFIHRYALGLDCTPLQFEIAMQDLFGIKIIAIQKEVQQIIDECTGKPS